MEEVLTLALCRCPVVVEILSFAEEQSQFSEHAVGRKGYGMHFRLPKLLKEFWMLKKLGCRTWRVARMSQAGLACRMYHHFLILPSSGRL
jgi:hypothetical protein